MNERNSSEHRDDHFPSSMVHPQITVVRVLEISQSDLFKFNASIAGMNGVRTYEHHEPTQLGLDQGRSSLPLPITRRVIMVISGPIGMVNQLH